MRLLLLCLLVPLAVAGEPAPLAVFSKHGVTVTLSLAQPDPAAGTAVVVGRFVPETTGFGKPSLHLYAHDLPKDAEAGVATRLEAVAPLLAAGDLTADRDVVVRDGLRTYPDGPVTLRLPVRLPPGNGSPVDAAVRVSYMACDIACRFPVNGELIRLRIPSAPPGKTSAPTANPGFGLGEIRAVVADELARRPPLEAAQVRALVAEELERARAQDQGRLIRWQRPHDRAGAERLIAAAHAEGRAAILDFTGPSCANCQRMAKTVLRLPEVVAAWNRTLAIEIDTDSHPDLAAWQQERFQSQSRPLYVRLAAKADGTIHETRWSEVFAASDRATLDRMLAFLGGGAGSDAGTGRDWTEFLLLALLGGLFTLLMPCTYPMVPFTLNVFAKQAAAGRRLVPLALFYGAGIMACFVGLGLLVTGVFGASLAGLAGHPLTNLLVALLFIVFGLSLLGAFLLRLPAGWEDRLGGARAGYLGAGLMGLTFAVTAFTCTAPFAGAVLAQAVATGTWGAAALGMAVYSAAIAVPFVALALVPGLLTRIPRAGAWMNELKVVGGIVEFAAALKFLVICDYHWGWGLFGRTSVTAAWAAGAVVLALYLFGSIRMKDDEPVPRLGLVRLGLGTACLATALWLAAGLAGGDLGVLESFFPSLP